MVERVGVLGKGLLNRGSIARAVEVPKDKICSAGSKTFLNPQ